MTKDYTAEPRRGTKPPPGRGRKPNMTVDMIATAGTLVATLAGS